jgi:hypothetical protein
MSTVAKSVDKQECEKRRRALRPPKTSQASPQARRQAAAILEVLAGLRRPAEAAQVLGTSLVRYYQWERRALDGLLAACEPAPRGPRPDLSRQIRRLEKEVSRLQREYGRQQALVRAAERSLGLAALSAGKAAVQGQEEKAGAGGKRRRVRRPTARALKAVRALRQVDAAGEPLEENRTEVSAAAPSAVLIAEREPMVKGGGP